MNDIPANFEHKGIKYNCHLTKVMGAGGTSTFHLYDDKNFYLGGLSWSDFENKWIFNPTPKTQDLVELGEYFGDIVSAWYQ